VRGADQLVWASLERGDTDQRNGAGDNTEGYRPPAFGLPRGYFQKDEWLPIAATKYIRKKTNNPRNDWPMKEETRGRKIDVHPLGEDHDRIDRLKHIRTSADFSQPNMAEKIGLPFRTYCKIESGERDLKASELAIILDHCGVDANWFLFGTGQKERKR